jgi:hypothetical protein
MLQAGVMVSVRRGAWLEVCVVKVQMVWFGLFIHSVTPATLDMPVKFYNLYITTQLTIYGHPPPHPQDNITNNNTKFKDQLKVQSVATC